MASYEESIVRLTNKQLSKLKSAAKGNPETTLRITNKNFQDEELARELFLTAKQKLKEEIPSLTICRQT